MRKKMAIMLGSVGIVFAALIGFNLFKKNMMKQYMHMAANQRVTVSTTHARSEKWPKTLSVIATVTAVNGVNVTTEVAGLIKTLPFNSGQEVKQGTILAELNTEAEVAALQVLQANLALAKKTYTRDKAQLQIKAISQAAFESSDTDLQSAQAAVDEQQALITKKTIRAPFDGRLGICNVNEGQFLNAGDPIVSLQALDPLYIDFNIPQHHLAKIQLKNSVQVRSDSFKGEVFSGEITTIEPQVNINTRNIKVEATLDNKEKKLLPGMFVKAVIDLGKADEWVVIPQSAVSFNPYGEIVYVVKEKGTDASGKQQYSAYQTFVKVGDKKGDMIAVVEGLKTNDQVVSSGQLKLKNESPININNSVQPATEKNPVVIDQ